MRTEGLLEGGPDATVEIRVRFLHVVRRRVGRAAGDGLELVDELEVAGERHLAWEEAVEREVVVGPAAVGSIGVCGRRAAIAVAAGSEREDLRHADGTRAGALIRSWHALDGAVEVAAERLDGALWRLSVTHREHDPVGRAARARTRSSGRSARPTRCCAPTAVRFVSLTDPPAALRAHAEACENTGTWPVLVGDAGRDRHAAVLADHPRGPPADRAREPGRPLRRRRDRPDARPQHPQPDRRGEGRDARVGSRGRARSSSAPRRSRRRRSCACTARSGTGR